MIVAGLFTGQRLGGLVAASSSVIGANDKEKRRLRNTERANRIRQCAWLFWDTTVVDFVVFLMLLMAWLGYGAIQYGPVRHGLF